MAVRTVTSDPRKSTRINGYYYIYYNKKLPTGSEALALVHPALKDIVTKGFIFDDNAVKYNPEYGASVLSLDFDESPVDDPSLPPDPEAGWGDPDHLTAISAEQEAAHTPVIPNRGVRPQAARRRAANALRDESRLKPELLSIADEVVNIFLYAYARLSIVGEARRADVAQKITATIAIPFYRHAGVDLSEQDVKSMTFMT